MVSKWRVFSRVGWLGLNSKELYMDFDSEWGCEPVSSSTTQPQWYRTNVQPQRGASLFSQRLSQTTRCESKMRQCNMTRMSYTWEGAGFPVISQLTIPIIPASGDKKHTKPKPWNRTVTWQRMVTCAVSGFMKSWTPFVCYVQSWRHLPSWFMKPIRSNSLAKFNHETTTYQFPAHVCLAKRAIVIGG